MNWQSSSVKPPTFSRATSQASATFDASVIAAEHAFAEEGAAELHAVEPADQLAVAASTSIEWAWPERWRPSIARSISVVDPGLLAVRAGRDDRRESRDRA